MTVSQQISPSVLRSLRISKYASTQKTPMILEAKRAKRITSQFMSRSGAKEAAKRMKELKKTASTTKKIADKAKEIQDAFFKKMPGGATSKNSGIAGGQLLSIVLQGGLAAAIINSILVQNFINDTVDRQFANLNNDLSKNLTLLTTLNSRVKNLDTRVNEFNKKITKELDANAKDYAQLNKQAETIAKNAVDAKKQANDALYETREGRKIVTGLAEAARKLGNDALYEARQNKQKLDGEIAGLRTNFDTKIQSINAQISKFNNSVSDTFQKTVNTTISKIQSDLAATRSKVDAIRPQNPVNTSEINSNAVAAARALVTPLQSQISQLSGLIFGFQAQASQIPILSGAISNLANSVSNSNNTANQALAEAKNKGVPNLAPLQQQLDDKFNRFVADNNKALGIRDLQQSNLSKEFDAKFADFQRLSNLTADQRFAEFKRENDRTLGIRDLQQSNLSKEFDTKFADFQRLSNLTADQRFAEFQQTNNESLGLIKKDLQQTTKEIEDNKIKITKIDTKLGEQAKVNDLALPKLDQILGILPLIPARAANAIRPDIPTIPQIEAAAATGTCRTTQPGGCMRRALDDNAANINQNTNNGINALDAANAGANAALLVGQQTILARLGAQLPGGIGGKLSRFAEWAHLDRVLNILIFAATVHNALMLSNDIGQTLLGAINNVLTLIGLKKEDGSSFDLGSVISGGIENLIKGAIGADNYTNLREAWAKANRIYQATTNVLNSFLNLSQTILQASELIAAYTGKIGNALKKGGVILESAYGWMNPQPKFNRVTQTLESLQNGASTIQMVTQAPLDVVNAVTESTTAATEFVKAVKEDDKPINKATLIPEPDELKAKEFQSKTDSQPLNFDFSDLFDGED